MTLRDAAGTGARIGYLPAMKLSQNQLWKKDGDYIRIIHLERMSVDYKLMKDPVTKTGTDHRATKKEFCQLIKGAKQETTPPPAVAEPA